MTQPAELEPERSDPIDLVLVEAMERMAAGDAHALEAVCRAHPALAGEIRERLGVLREMNLLPTDEAAMAFPSRLGEFRLLRRLGGGGMGVVYEAVQEPLARRVALKLIRPEQLYFPRARERFRRETEAVARLSHPGIASIHTVGEAQGTPYFAMEMIHGVSLADALDQVGTSAPEHLAGSDLRAAALAAAPDQLREGHDDSPELFVGSWVDTATRVAVQLCEALAHAHGRGILHRDVKPSNVIVTPAGRVVLLDFGLAGLESELRMTMTGTTLGSVLYMAPEQVAGRVDQIDARTDVYALGVTLYELLTLKLPFEGQDAEQARAAILEGRAPSIRARNPEVGRDLEVVCLKAIEREPARRYASMDAFGADLKRVLDGHPILARPPSAWYRTWSWVRRHPTTSTAIALTVVLALAVPTALYWQQRAHSGELALERDEAVAARAKAAAESERANLEARDAEAASNFLVSIFRAADPYQGSHDVTALEMLSAGEREIDAQLGNEPELQARLLEHIGESYTNLDRYDQALHPLEHALALRRQLHGEDDPRTAKAMSLLASARRLCGQPDVVPLLRKAIEVLSRTPDVDANKLLEQRVLLALSLIDSGEHDEPLAILREARSRFGDVPADQRALRWSLMSMVASGFTRLEEYAQAESLAREALKQDGEIGLKPHAWRLAMLDILGDSLHWQGRADEAAAIYAEAVPEAEAFYEPDNPSLLTIKSKAALVDADLGRVEDADAELRAAYDGLNERFGVEDKHTLNALIMLTGFLTRQGKIDEALGLLDNARKHYDGRLAPSDPRVVKLLERIGSTLGAKGDAAAETTLRRARAAASETQFASIDATLAAVLVRDPARHAEAANLAQAWINDWRSGVALATRYVLARAAFLDRRYDDAEHIANEALALPGAKNGMAWSVGACKLVLGEIQVARGQTEAGQRAIDGALDELAERLGNSHATVSEARARVGR